MGDFYDMKNNISARRIILILLVFLLCAVIGLVIFASCNSNFAWKLARPHSFYATFPRLSEEWETLTSKSETYQYVFSHDDWGPWMMPGINVTFQFKATGDLIIEELSRCDRWNDFLKMGQRKFQQMKIVGMVFL